MCSVGFAVSMLRLQTAMRGSPVPLSAVLEIVPSLRAAIELAAKDETYRALVAISGFIAFPPSFVLRALSSGKPFVAGVYPLPRIDWDRVKAKAHSKSKESMEFRGNVYNIDAANAQHVGGGFMEVPHGDVEPGAVVLTREAIVAVSKCVPLPVTDAGVPAAWGQAIAVDVDAPCSTFGPVEFFGCVGTRSVLR